MVLAATRTELAEAEAARDAALASAESQKSAAIALEAGRASLEEQLQVAPRVVLFSPRLAQGGMAASSG